MLASPADVGRALSPQRTLTDPESAQAQTLIAEASDLVIGYLHQDPSQPGPVPPTVTRVVARMVARVLAPRAEAVAPGTVQTGFTAGPFARQATYSEGATSGSPWLEKTDKVKLNPYRLAGGFASLGMVSERGSS